MLHRVNLPGCLPQLERIIEFQREVLQYTCDRIYQLPLLENDLKTLFGNDKGEWFWNKLWTQPKKKNGVLPPKQKSNLHKSLIKLTQHYDQNNQEGRDTLTAFDNDILFADNLDNATFRFLYPALTPQNKNLIKPLMIAFYEDLLTSGFLQAVHGSTDRLNRDDFIASFWKNNVNLNVCPACDREKSEKVDIKVYDDADHFLPKSKYPFLSLHPYNLFPLCIYCNRSFKGDRDIIDDLNNAPLPNIFHPYEKPILEKLNLEVFRDSVGVSKLGEFIDLDGMPSRRMISLNKVFRLSERWTERLRIQKEILIDKVTEDGKRIRRRNDLHLITELELTTIIQEDQNYTVRSYGKRPGFIVHNSYLSCVLNDSDEFQELYNYFAGL